VPSNPFVSQFDFFAINAKEYDPFSYDLKLDKTLISVIKNVIPLSLSKSG
jgi:hypothetical protein